jgi:hypothetical protein
MLDVAIHYKLDFSDYATRDSSFEWVPEEVEWEKTEKLVSCLWFLVRPQKYFHELLIPP